MASGDVYRLKILCLDTASNLTAENSIAFRATSSTVLDTQQEDLVERFIDEVQLDYTACFSSRYYIVKYTVVDLPANLVSYEHDVTPENGLLTGDMLPVQTSALISIKTTKLGRRGRGRVFLPPASEAVNQAEGLVASSQITSMNTLGTVLLGMNTINLAYATYEVGVWSQADQEFAPAVSIVARNKWATQRGRTR